ncbi:MAG: hypothetical protein ACKO14_10505, partial [Armatimonadota bacterium]
MAERLSPTDIHQDYANVLTTQSYASRTNIDGVKIIELRTFQDDGGAFAEIIRLDDNGRLVAIPDFQVRQSSWSVVQPGAIKA